MEEFLSVVFKVFCIIAPVFAVLSTNPSFLAWAEQLGVTKWMMTSYQSYVVLCMVLLGWIVIYSGVIHLLIEQWEVIIPVSVFLTMITLHGLNKSKELYLYTNEIKNTEQKKTSV